MRPTVVMLAGLGLLYLLYSGRAEAVISALSSGGSGWSGGGSGWGGGGGGGGADGGGGFNGSNDALTTAPVKGYKSKPNSEKCPKGYKWDHTRNTCVIQ